MDFIRKTDPFMSLGSINEDQKNDIEKWKQMKDTYLTEEEKQTKLQKIDNLKKKFGM